MIGKDVLELGAGAGLPSLVCVLLGAKKVRVCCLPVCQFLSSLVKVVVTDYPDTDLIENLKHNIEHCEPVRKLGANVTAEVCCSFFDPNKTELSLLGLSLGSPDSTDFLRGL